jgi:hypothetical protein
MVRGESGARGPTFLRLREIQIALGGKGARLKPGPYIESIQRIDVRI